MLGKVRRVDRIWSLYVVARFGGERHPDSRSALWRIERARGIHGDRKTGRHIPVCTLATVFRSSDVRIYRFRFLCGVGG